MPSARHGLSVLNTGELSEAAARAWRAARAGQLETEDVSPRDYQVAEDLRGWTVLPVARIIHKHGDGQSGEFDGWYLGGLRLQALGDGRPLRLLRCDAQHELPGR
jgi:hypothetical protein